MIKHAITAWLWLVLGLSLAACAGGVYPIKSTAVATEPTAWATVKNPPNPLLLGHWRRIPPGKFRRPDIYDYWLVRRGDRYAVYYYWQGHEIEQRHQGWAPFVIDGDALTSQVDGSRFFVRDGRVWHNLGGRSLDSPMKRAGD